MPPPLPELPGTGHEHVQLATGVRVHVATAGPSDAPPIVLLHGWPQHWWCWRRVVPLLERDFRLLMPDLRGFGWSGEPADGDYRKARLAGDAIALLDALGIDRAGLIGHDWGGWAAFLAGARFPERLTGVLALGIAHPWQPVERALRNLHRIAYQLPLATPVLGPQVVARGLAATMIRAGWGDMSTFDPEAAALFDRACRERGAASSRLYRDFLVRELPRGLAGEHRGRRLEIPTRLLYGERDVVAAPFAAGLERHGDDARAQALAGCGHFTPEERPREVADAARALFTPPLPAASPPPPRG